MRLLGTVCCGVLLASAAAAASAANINTNMSECQAQFWPQDDVVHSERGVATASNLNVDRLIACTVLRAPLIFGATKGDFFVDGDTVNGAITVCSLVSYDYTGAFLGSTSFSSKAANYDVLLSLPAAQLGTWAYTGITCLLPPHGNGTLRGVTSLQ